MTKKKISTLKVHKFHKMPRILLLLPTTSYRATDFIEAARKLKVELTVGAERKNLLESQNPDGYLELDFDHPECAAKTVSDFSRTQPLQAVLGMDDSTALVAAFISRELSLDCNSVESLEASRNKYLMRERFREAGLLVPRVAVFSIDEDPESICSKVSYPCVLKPLMLAASQGVIRVSDESGFLVAWNRIKKIVKDQKTVPQILVESYIPGFEVAVEGLLEKGKILLLAIFDKPDPMDGPFFEETIYVTPSRLPTEIQSQIVSSVAQGTEALGLKRGPVHAELRINQDGVWIIEIAARPIGGRCSRVLRFGSNISLEELIIRHTLGLETLTIKPDSLPSGVMMIPIPKAGVLKQIIGIEEAKSIPGVEEIILNAHPGKKLVPLPEGSAYLGFIFCRAETPELVEKSLRQSHSCLEFVIERQEAKHSRPLPGTVPFLMKKE